MSLSLSSFSPRLPFFSFALPSLYREAVCSQSAKCACGPAVGGECPLGGEPPVAVKCLLPSWLRGSGSPVPRDMPPGSGLAPLRGQQALTPGGGGLAWIPAHLASVAQGLAADQRALVRTTSGSWRWRSKTVPARVQPEPGLPGCEACGPSDFRLRHSLHSSSARDHTPRSPC